MRYPPARSPPRPHTLILPISHPLTSRTAGPFRTPLAAVSRCSSPAAPGCLAAVSACGAGGGERGPLVEAEVHLSPYACALVCAACAEISGPARAAHARSMRTCLCALCYCCYCGYSTTKLSFQKLGDCVCGPPKLGRVEEMVRLSIRPRPPSAFLSLDSTGGASSIFTIDSPSDLPAISFKPAFASSGPAHTFNDPCATTRLVNRTRTRQNCRSPHCSLTRVRSHWPFPLDARRLMASYAPPRAVCKSHTTAAKNARPDGTPHLCAARRADPARAESIFPPAPARV